MPREFLGAVVMADTQPWATDLWWLPRQAVPSTFPAPNQSQSPILETLCRALLNVCHFHVQKSFFYACGFRKKRTEKEKRVKALMFPIGGATSYIRLYPFLSFVLEDIRLELHFLFYPYHSDRVAAKLRLFILCLSTCVARSATRVSKTQHF